MKIKILKWWKEIDRVIFILSILLIAVGIILSLTGTTEIKGFDSTHFIKRHLTYSFLSILVIILFSSQDIKTIRRISVIGLFITIIFMFLVIIFGHEINGSKRWFSIFGFTLQPSEFLKPFFAVISGWFLSKGLEGRNFGFKIIFSLFIISSSLLILQPDFGMTFLFFVVFFAQLFVAGLSLVLVFALVLILLILTISSYLMIPNVRNRLNMYLDPASHDTYQLDLSLKAFKSGGIFGKGLGQGTLKEDIPDAHTDFIFSIAGEELGFIFCTLLILIFLIIVIRSLLSILKKREIYSLIVVVGLICIFGLQALINISSSIGAAPTKGMTLPLISYGGSSMLSSSLLIGILLSHLRYLRYK